MLEMLGKLEEETQRQPLKDQFRHHADETRQQTENIQKAFEALGEQPDDSPCPAIEGLAKAGQAITRKANDSVIDAVILFGAAEAEHHEIAVYEADHVASGRAGVMAGGSSFN